MSIDNVKSMTATNQTKAYIANHPELNDSIAALAAIWDSIVSLSVSLSNAHEFRNVDAETLYEMWDNIHTFEQLVDEAVPLAQPLAYMAIMAAAQDVEQVAAPTDSIQWFIFKRDKLNMDDMDWPEIGF